MSKPKLNIREMIRSGEIDTARAGQLVSLHYYTKSGLLSDSDERALRETAKDGRLYNAYMAGGRTLHETEIFLIGLSSEAKLGIQKLAWIGAELKYTIETYYQPPRVVALTDEAYERIGKEKRGRRLKRTYTLVTLYRIFAENFIYNEKNRSKADEQLLADLRKDPEDASEDNVYGLDLIDTRGKGDVIEYWRGWMPYYNGYSQEHDGELSKLETIDKIGGYIPELDGLIRAGIDMLYKDKKLDVKDPSKTPLDQWHETPLKGSELAKLEENLPYLQEILNSTEWTLLDDYKDEGETIEIAQNRSIFENRMQVYSIIKNPEGIGSRRLKDGIYDDTSEALERPLSWGYKLGQKDEALSGKMPLATIINNRKTIGTNLLILYVLNEWRKKAGELLGIDKTEEFIAFTDWNDAIDLYHTYEVHRQLLTDHIRSQSYIRPEYRGYTDEIVNTYKPLGDESNEYSVKYRNYLNTPLDESKSKNLEPVQELFKSNRYVTEALDAIDGITINSLADSFYRVRDILQPILDGKYKDSKQWSEE